MLRVALFICGFVTTAHAMSQEEAAAQAKETARSVQKAFVDLAKNSDTFKAELEKRCQIQSSCFKAATDLALTMEIINGNIKGTSITNKTIVATGITGAFKSCFPKFDRDEVLELANDAVDKIASGETTTSEGNIDFKQCMKAGSAAYDAEAFDRFNLTMYHNLNLFLASSAKDLNLTTIHVYCLNNALSYARASLWKSGIFKEDNNDAETDSVTGAFMECLPELGEKRDVIRSTVNSYVTNSSAALEDVERLFDIHFPRIAKEKTTAMLKTAALGATAGISFFLAGLAVGRRLWGGRSQQIAVEEAGPLIE